jgi:hypothetical protein
MFPEFPDIPAIAAKDTKYRIGSCDRVKLPVDGLEQRRFSAAVRPYDGDSFMLLDDEIEILENAGRAAPDCGIAHFNEGHVRLHEFSILRVGIR